MMLGLAGCHIPVLSGRVMTSNLHPARVLGRSGSSFFSRMDRMPPPPPLPLPRIRRRHLTNTASEASPETSVSPETATAHARTHPHGSLALPQKTKRSYANRIDSPTRGGGERTPSYGKDPRRRASWTKHRRTNALSREVIPPTRGRLAAADDGAAFGQAGIVVRRGGQCCCCGCRRGVDDKKTHCALRRLGEVAKLVALRDADTLRRRRQAAFHSRPGAAAEPLSMDDVSCVRGVCVLVGPV
jgi:hypothetical protein